MKKQSTMSFKILWFSGLSLVVLASSTVLQAQSTPSPSEANVAPIAVIRESKTAQHRFSGKNAHVEEITRLAQAHEVGQLTIRPGDAVSKIAQAYARLNNIPFEAALKGLIVANPETFEDAQHNLKINAVFVLPLKEDVLQAAQTGILPTVSAVAPVAAEPAAAAATPVLAATPESSVAQATVEPTAPQTKPVPKPTNQSETMLSTLWVWPLLGVFALMGLTMWSRSRKKNSDDDVAAGIERHDNGAPKVILGAHVESDEKISARASQSVATAAAQSVNADESTAHASSFDEDDLPELDETTPLSTPMLDARFNQALGGLSAESLDLTTSARASNDVGLVQEEQATTAFEAEPEHHANVQQAIQTANPSVVHRNFFNHNLKTPMQQWQDLGVTASVSVMAVNLAHAKAEAMSSVQVPAEVLEVETAATPTLDMDVPKFLNAFSHQLPEPTFTSVDYEDLLDRTRLQAWLNMHTPEQILLFAQDAHDARYDDVAQLMLNDVLLRGTADQCAAVLNLRYLWSYPQGVS